jgi:hypothetical protein
MATAGAAGGLRERRRLERTISGIPVNTEVKIFDHQLCFFLYIWD